MYKLVCSICGYVGNQKRFKYKDINIHFENAIEIWCPTNKCISENKEKRIVPNGYIKTCWHDYCGWYAIEERHKILDIDTAKSIQKAKQLREIGIQMLKEQGD